MPERLMDGLEAHGYEVLIARCGMDALNAARWSLPDIILIDLMLDDMDGLVVCEILRRQPATVRIPVMLMTALAGEMARVNGLGSGVDDFICKPVRPHDLLPRMEALLKSRPTRRTAVLADVSEGPQP